ncbi:MAG TPA: glycoside hydrolase family 15 protein [Polyangiaceae bacterium]|nr:glycoside hydrolase family 15 protein [Polyangiaceae bacterium]
MRPIIWHNEELRALRQSARPQPTELERVVAALEQRGALTLQPLRSGLFPAAAVVGAMAPTSGYQNVWVRDNVYVACAHEARGRLDVAGRIASKLFEFFWKYRQRFQAIIAGTADPDDVMNRPHIRFDGESLEELSGQRWSHAQNDALGYALWLFARLASAGVVPLDARAVEVLQLFPSYFAAIRYWEDEDSGHWEETRRRSASSIGAALAGLEAAQLLTRARFAELKAAGFAARAADQISELAVRGRAALAEILPGECAQLSPRQNRRYDAALLFLLHPLDVVGAPHRELILADVERFLTSDVGVRRYLGDSYWAPNYDEHMSESDRTRDFSDDIETRDVLLDRIGHEAEWCIFDPILSAHYGKRYQRTRSSSDLARQIHHLDRSLAHITSEWRCPELYYLKRGEFLPNPHTPLLWTQANLIVALSELQRNLG